MKEIRYPNLKNILLRAVGSRSEQEVADWCGVSQPAVNGWLSGYTRPRRSHLAILTALLKLDPTELAQAAGYKPKEIIALYEANFFGEHAFFDYIESESNTVDFIHKQWIRGDAELALEQSIVTNHRLVKALDRYSSPNYRQLLLRIRSKILFEQECSYSISYAPNQAFRAMLSTAEEQSHIAEELADNDILAQVYRNWGSAYYVQKEYDKAQLWFSEALALTQDEHWRIWIMPKIAIAFASLGNAKKFQWAELQIKTLLEKEQIPILAACEAIEGLARGQSILEDPQVFKTLEEGWKIYSSAEVHGEKSALRQLQLIRSHMKAVVHIDEGSKNVIEELGARGLALANEHGYLRYKVELEKLLLENLN